MKSASLDGSCELLKTILLLLFCFLVVCAYALHNLDKYDYGLA